jgi:uncharacterized protein (DUF2237 family)
MNSFSTSGGYVYRGVIHQVGKDKNVQTGDVIGVLLDFDEKLVSFYRNGADAFGPNGLTYKVRCTIWL